MASEKLENIIRPDSFVSKLLCCLTNFRYINYFAAFCLSGLVFSHSFVENSVSGPLINYIPSAWNSKLPRAATITSINEGLSSIFIFVFTILSIDYLGTIKTIIVSTFLYLMGLIMLGLSVRKFSSESSYALFLVGGLLVSIGKAAKTVLRTFLVDQLCQQHDHVVMTNAPLRFAIPFCAPCLSDTWWHCTCVSGVICSIVYQFYMPTTSGIRASWHIVVSSVLIVVAGSLFCCGFSFYICSRPASNSRSLEVTQLEAVKNMLKMLPMWLVFVPYTFVKMASVTFFFLQVESIKPAGCSVSATSSFLLMVSELTNSPVSYMIGWFISKLKLNAKQVRDAALVKIGVGLIFSSLCCIVADQLEHSRLYHVIELGETKNTANYWMIPLFMCVGLMQALAEGGLDDLQMSYVPESWNACGLNSNVLALGLMKLLNIPFIFAFSGWIKDSVNTSQLDQYYLISAEMSAVSCIICYCICTYFYRVTETPGTEAETRVVSSASAVG